MSQPQREENNLWRDYSVNINTVCAGFVNADNKDCVGLIQDYVGGGIGLDGKSKEELLDGSKMELDRFLVREEVERGKWKNVNPPEYHGLPFSICFCLLFLWLCNKFGLGLYCFGLYTDSVEFEFRLRKGMEGYKVEMTARADAASFEKGFVYVAAYSKRGIVGEQTTKYEVGGWQYSLPAVVVLRLDGAAEDLRFDFVVKCENKDGINGDEELLLDRIW